MQERCGLLVFAFCLVGFLTVCRAGPFPLDRLQPGQMTMSGHYDDQKTSATYTVTRETHDGSPCLRAVWDSRIKKIDMWMRPDGTPIRSRLEKPEEGVVVEIEYTPGGAVYKYTEKGETETTRIKQKGLIEVLAIDLLLVAFPFEHKDREVIFYGIDADSDDGDTYKFYAEVDEIETVTIGGQKIKAYKIELGLKGVVGLFAPEFHFWYSFEKPHEYLMYDGPDEKFVKTGGRLAL
jgi:hypothetical protein